MPSLNELLMRVPPVLFALTIHEYAHAWMAWRCGDPTARDLGRLTLHPLAHLDPIGTLCLLLARFGWARPVPVNPANFRHPRRDDILVSLAGVAANLATAVVVAIILRVAVASGANPATFTRPTLILWSMATVLAIMSVGLMIFNLIPIPPLDGSHVLMHFLPRDMALAYRRAAPAISMIFLFLAFSGALGSVLGVPLVSIVRLLLGPASPF